MAQQGDGSRKIQSVNRAFEIISVLGKRQSATVSELSNEIDLSVSTIHSHLSTLMDHGIITQDETLYRLGPNLLILAEQVRNNSRLFHAGREEVDALAKTTGECVHLIIEHNGLEVSLYESFSEDAAGTKFYIKNRENSSRHLESTAAGKAILAHLEEEQTLEIFEQHGLLPKTKNTITDVDTLLSELSTIRERGYAFNDEEEILRMRAVGTPILGRDENVLGALSVSAPVSHMDKETFTDTIPEMVLESKNLIEIQIESETYEIE